MGDRAVSSKAEDERAVVGLAVARDRQRDLLRHGLSLAASSRRRSAMELGLSQVRGLAQRLHLREDQSCPGLDGS